MSTKEDLNKEIARLHITLENLNPVSDDYLNVLQRLDVLYAIKNTKNPNMVSIDTLVSAGATILNLLLVLNYEKVDVIASKAFGMIFTKGRS